MNMYKVMLATLDCEPAYVAFVDVYAASAKEAQRLAFDKDYSLLTWKDGAGNAQEWDNIDSRNLAVAIVE